MTTTTYAIKHSHGTTETGYETYEDAIAAVRSVYTSAELGHSGDIADGGERTLVWVDAATAQDDDGVPAMQHTFKLGDQVQAGRPGTDSYDLGTVDAVDEDGIHIDVRWASGCTTTERWDQTDLDYPPSCARCRRRHYVQRAQDGMTCTHCGLERTEAV